VGPSGSVGGGGLSENLCTIREEIDEITYPFFPGPPVPDAHSAHSCYSH
jgi:hypothetical protein